MRQYFFTLYTLPFWCALCQSRPETGKPTLKLKFLASYENITHEAAQWIAERDTMLQLLRANSTLLSAYDVSVDIIDAQFKAVSNIGITVHVFFDYILDNRRNWTATNNNHEDGEENDVIAPLFFGPENSAEVRVIAQVAPFYNLICLSSNAKSTDLSDRQQYPLFFRTAFTVDIMVPVARFVLRYFDYSRVALAYVDKPIPFEALQKVDVDLHLSDGGLNENSDADSPPFDVLFRVKFTLDESSYTQLWKTIDAYDARVIVSYVNERDTYRIFCNAVMRGKAADANRAFDSSKYLLLFLGSATVQQLMPPASSRDAALMPNCSYEELSNALVGTFIVTQSLQFPLWAPDDTRLSFGLTSLELQKRCRALSKPSMFGGNRKLNTGCIPVTLDAYWTAFVALDALDRRLGREQPPRSLRNFTYQSKDIATLLWTEMQNVQFQGASGLMSFSVTGERTSDLIIDQYQRLRRNSNYSQNDFGFRHVFRLPGLNARGVELLAPLQFATKDGLRPPDKEPTIAAVEVSSSLLTLIVLLAVGAALVFVCATTLVVYLIYRRQLQRTLANPPWLLEQQKIMFKSVAASMMSTTSESALASTKSADFATSDYTTPAMFHGQAVAVQHIPLDAARLTINRQTHLLFTNFRDNLQHANVARFLGYARSPHHNSQYLLWEHCSKGSLEQLVENDSINLDATFQFAIMLDVAQGMAFLHKSFLHSHGSLCAAACMIDKRFTVKVARHGEALLAPMFGLRRFVPIVNDSVSKTGKNEQAEAKDVSLYAERRLYWAPELLRQEWPPVVGTQYGDVYAFAITVYVLLTRSAPFETSLASPTADIMPVTASEVLKRLREVRSKTGKPPYRPQVTSFVTDKRLAELIENCWAEDPASRPNFSVIIHRIQNISGVKSSNITDQLFRRLEQYADDMELLVQERTQELTLEKQRSDELLNSILPSAIAEELKRNGSVQPESFDCVTIYFSDIVGFTTLSSSSSPVQIVTLLNALYTLFDAKIDLFDAYKVETIGDAYMVVSGLPQPNGKDHVVHIARLSLALLDDIKDFVIPHRPDEKLLLRIGLHTGPCVAGVVGIKMPRYCLFGDTVNTASRMESTGKAHRIHISEVVRNELTLYGDYFVIKERGKVDVKGKGAMQTYWLLGTSIEFDLPNTAATVIDDDGDGTVNFSGKNEIESR